ncbi:hypothetical protein [Nocardia sp. NPDC048505]|uniref:hypothetical protein n=1 Tax=unclassified Nocardia TaxID=2637762 RepID=UPI00340323BD
MDINGKSPIDRLAEIEQWQTFRGEVDTWAFREIETRLLALHSKIVHSCDRAPDLSPFASDVLEVLGVVRRRHTRLREHERQSAE